MSISTGTALKAAWDLAKKADLQKTHNVLTQAAKILDDPTHQKALGSHGELVKKGLSTITDVTKLAIDMKGKSDDEKRRMLVQRASQSDFAKKHSDKIALVRALSGIKAGGRKQRKYSRRYKKTIQKSRRTRRRSRRTRRKYSRRSRH